MLVDVGRVVANKYELVRLLGRGSMGEVWGAHHRTLGEHVALKLLTPAPGRNPGDTGTFGAGEGDPFGNGGAGGEGFEVAVAEASEVAAARFRFEAQIAARLSRKTRHIVQVTDHGEDDGLAYLVMELLDGDTLEALLLRDARVPLERARTIVNQVARALEQAHAEGVVHRDLKPANVFLTRDEDGQLLVKVLDFGIARATHAHWLKSAPGGPNSQGPGGRAAFTTAKGFVFGTPGYMSPEQARASSELDHQCDLWALATIAYQMVTGMLPVDGYDADELLRNLCAGRIVPLHVRSPAAPEALGAFFDRAFAERAEDRYSSATALVEAFERACGLPSEGVASLGRARVSSPSALLGAPNAGSGFAPAEGNGSSLAPDTALTRTARRTQVPEVAPRRAGKVVTGVVVAALLAGLAAALVVQSRGGAPPAKARAEVPPTSRPAPVELPSLTSAASPPAPSAMAAPPPVVPAPWASGSGGSSRAWQPPPAPVASALPPSSPRHPPRAPPAHARPTEPDHAPPAAPTAAVAPAPPPTDVPDRNEVF